MRRSSVVGLIAAVILIAAAVLAINHKSNNTNTSTTNTGTNTNTAQPPASQNQSQNQATENTVDIRNMAFTPSQITVKKGTTVTWTNNDSTTHTVTADNGNGPSSDNISPGSSYKYTFNDTGSFQYHCTIHPSMRGTVVVQ